MVEDKGFKKQQELTRFGGRDVKSTMNQTDYLEGAERQNSKTEPTQELSPSHFLSQSDVKRSQSNSKQKGKPRS